MLRNPRHEQQEQHQDHDHHIVPSRHTPMPHRPHHIRQSHQRQRIEHSHKKVAIQRRMLRKQEDKQQHTAHQTMSKHHHHVQRQADPASPQFARPNQNEQSQHSPPHKNRVSPLPTFSLTHRMPRFSHQHLSIVDQTTRIVRRPAHHSVSQSSIIIPRHETLGPLTQQRIHISPKQHIITLLSPRRLSRILMHDIAIRERVPILRIYHRPVHTRLNQVHHLSSTITRKIIIAIHPILRHDIEQKPIATQSRLLRQEVNHLSHHTAPPQPVLLQKILRRHSHTHIVRPTQHKSPQEPVAIEVKHPIVKHIVPPRQSPLSHAHSSMSVERIHLTSR